jgi:hypothetical protein
MWRYLIDPVIALFDRVQVIEQCPSHRAPAARAAQQTPQHRFVHAAALRRFPWK